MSATVGQTRSFAAEPVVAMEELDRLSQELDLRSNELAQVDRELSGSERAGEHVMGVEEAYEEWLDVYTAGLWEKHVKDGAKFPSEDVRLRLARIEMPEELLGRYSELRSRRKRLENRIRDIRVRVEAQRSILSALRSEMEATR